ncbi:MAG TPA: hypothetical protein VK843_10875 [Planctomycetota bacterium]|nr:hypothetical protein [Planctomycetota bacterium]
MAFAPLAPLVCALTLATAASVQETQFVATATTTHFEAVNPNSFTVLMVLGNANGARTQMLIAPGAHFETSFPSGTLDDVYIEIVFFSPNGRVSSGAVSFDSMIDWDADRIEVDLAGPECDAWICTNGMRLSAESGFNLVPTSLLGSTAPSTAPLVLDPAHVPEITPEDIDDDNVAPKIRGPINPI